jgi:hypothetical protein
VQTAAMQGSGHPEGCHRCSGPALASQALPAAAAARHSQQRPLSLQA